MTGENGKRITDPFERADAAMNRLAMWRTVLVGWQLGTRPKGDPESDAVADLRDQSLAMRAELNALLNLLIAHGAVDPEHMAKHLEESADALSGLYGVKFPGITATDHGLDMDVVKVAEWMKARGWKP